ncbi:hypothetical protein [Rathayibacter tanaceti]|uniref:Uncharacterized protein n=1 Tax=Rathayibacter tanaceti TaxID=1671680 RepID=A0AAE6RJ10_9MICO|nr:hypothetical protein [Rathayibacter tanaceti]QHC55097.1 hypothetical protein GSU10_05245 [Rathayibacter tanaceti]
MKDSRITFSLTKRDGAVKYEARGIGEQVLGSSSSPSISLPAEKLKATAIVALDGSGKIVDFFPFRINKYETSTDRDSVVYGQEKNGAHYVRWLSDVRTPRIVTRYVTNPFTSDAPSKGEAIAITCLSEFVDTDLDETKQYEYKVEPLTLNGGRECGGSAYPSAVTERPAGGVTLPFTRYPVSEDRQSGKNNVNGENDSTRLGQEVASVGTSGHTLADLSIEGAGTPKDSRSANGRSSEKKEDDQTTQSTQSGNDIQPMEVYYEQYIPDDKVWMPGFSGDLQRPAIFLHGDGREWFDLNGSNRVKNQVSVTFGRNHGIYPHTPSIGESRAYACDLGGNNCRQKAAETASSNGASTNIIYSSESFASFHMAVNATIPSSVYWPAPAINGQVTVVLQPGGSRAYGTHDMMPRHQVWYGNSNADAYLAYQNDDYFPLGLFGIPPTSFNVSF